ncbi:MAG: ACP phosphodiesterase [Bacteroidales bacterium]|jgi:acyl carrier protein phosphodiesterase|nr:ACP phosphodiesterase [Bacteroidales bacterium]
MNFLAHAYLSGNNDDILIGNFIADAVKGSNVDRFREGIRKGIRLHREIDSFTDQHAVFLRSKQKIQNEYGRYSGVVIDIYYDHFLARNWEEYSDLELSEFAIDIYRLMLANYNILPAKSKRILPYMVIHNWLVGYSRLQDLQWVFNGMSRRSKKYNSGMEGAVDSLRLHYEAFHADFSEFFPDLIAHAKEFRATL